MQKQLSIIPHPKSIQLYSHNISKNLYQQLYRETIQTKYQTTNMFSGLSCKQKIAALVHSKLDSSNTNNNGQIQNIEKSDELFSKMFQLHNQPFSSLDQYIRYKRFSYFDSLLKDSLLEPNQYKIFQFTKLHHQYFDYFGSHRKTQLKIVMLLTQKKQKFTMHLFKQGLKFERKLGRFSELITNRQLYTVFSPKIPPGSYVFDVQKFSRKAHLRNTIFYFRQIMGRNYQKGNYQDNGKLTERIRNLVISGNNQVNSGQLY
eukprot:TRINITY_DN13333_c0_g1_i1.p1 TRINITY_DN13333_c0_g1~~TRINITY_DN13333_c0_g1_i1.p1  ORF type:complete len:260 (+),score=-17.15 TRINITY_DN13333_c0_g1_i1:491-1270(+)